MLICTYSCRNYKKTIHPYIIRAYNVGTKEVRILSNLCMENRLKSTARHEANKQFDKVRMSFTPTVLMSFMWYIFAGDRLITVVFMFDGCNLSCLSCLSMLPIIHFNRACVRNFTPKNGGSIRTHKQEVNFSLKKTCLLAKSHPSIRIQNKAFYSRQKRQHFK